MFIVMMLYSAVARDSICPGFTILILTDVRIYEVHL